MDVKGRCAGFSASGGGVADRDVKNYCNVKNFLSQLRIRADWKNPVKNVIFWIRRGFHRAESVLNAITGFGLILQCNLKAHAAGPKRPAVAYC